MLTGLGLVTWAYIGWSLVPLASVVLGPALCARNRRDRELVAAPASKTQGTP